MIPKTEQITPRRIVSHMPFRQIVAAVIVLTMSMSMSGQSFKRHENPFDSGDDYHFGYVSGSIGYSMLHTSVANAVPVGSAGGAVGIGYEFRNSGLWVNVGVQMSFHRSSLRLNDYDTYNASLPYNSPEYDRFRGVDTQGKPAVFHYRVSQTDEITWNYIDIPMLVGYYVKGFHVGAGLKVSYAVNPTTHSTGVYNLSASNEGYYPLRFENMPDRGYTDYKFDNTIANQLNVGVSLIGEIGYDLLSSVPSRSRICNVLKLAFYVEYGLNNQLRVTETPAYRVEIPDKNDATKAVINPYFNTIDQSARTVPFFTGVKLTYMIGGSRTARAGLHHGCMCYQ